MLKLADFDYHLPEELIATTPAKTRSSSRLLVVDSNENTLSPKLTDSEFSALGDFIKPNDLLIFNDSKVFKARLFGQKLSSGKIELLIERILANRQIIAHIKSNKTIKIDLVIELPNEVQLKVSQILGDGLFLLTVNANNNAPLQQEFNWLSYLDQFGEVPLPPYIKRSATVDDTARYQTIYAKEYGSVAAPTAGLHFSKEMLTSLPAKRVKFAYVTLHVGAGTFKPVSSENISEHKMHSELYSVPEATIAAIKQCKLNGNQVIAVGTTTLRTLEAIAQTEYRHENLSGATEIFITPGFKFKVVDRLLTNFHLPKSTLLMLVSSFAGMDTIKTAYQHAIAQQYRFFSYGDAMLLSLSK